jgi:hypothetical protein
MKIPFPIGVFRQFNNLCDKGMVHAALHAPRTQARGKARLAETTPDTGNFAPCRLPKWQYDICILLYGHAPCASEAFEMDGTRGIVRHDQ